MADRLRARTLSRLRAGLVLSLIILCSSCQGFTSAGADQPAGSPADVSYARRLWAAMEAEKMVGAQARHLEPFIGAARPHGWILEIDHRNIVVDGHTGFLVMKNNYNGTDLTVAQVEADRARYLSSVTVMYQREAGYDPQDQDWFWVKYKPNGDLFNRPMGSKQVPMAGRLFKGKDGQSVGGCLYCHRSAGGGDYIFYPDIVKP